MVSLDDVSAKVFQMLTCIGSYFSSNIPFTGVNYEVNTCTVVICICEENNERYNETKSFKMKLSVFNFFSKVNKKNKK